MNRYDRRTTLLAAALSALAGFVDAIGFLTMGGFFVSFMSGNSTRFGVGVAQGSINAAFAGGLIGTFVIGVILGSMTGHAAGRFRRGWVLTLVAGLLLVTAAIAPVGEARVATIILMTLAMGAENAAFEANGEVQIGLTYMTGTLVKLGQRIAAALRGGDRYAWWPYLLLWGALAGGAASGAAAYGRFGLGALWFAAAGAAALAVVGWRMPGARTPAR